MKPGKKRKHLSLKERAVRISNMVRRLAIDNARVPNNGELNPVALYNLQDVANDVAYGLGGK